MNNYFASKNIALTAILLLFYTLTVSCTKGDPAEYARKGQMRSISFTGFGPHYFQKNDGGIFGIDNLTASVHGVKDTSLIAICCPIRGRYDIPNPRTFEKTKDIEINALVILLPESAQIDTDIELDNSSFFLFYSYWGDDLLSSRPDTFLKVAEIEQCIIRLSSNEIVEIQLEEDPPGHYISGYISGSFSAKGSVKQSGSGESIPFDIQDGLFVVKADNEYHFRINGIVPGFDLIIEKCVEYQSGIDYPDCWWYDYCEASCSCDDDIYSCKSQRCNEQLCNKWTPPIIQYTKDISAP